MPDKSPNKLKPVYFPGLDGLRAIASLIVLIFHTDQFSHYFGLESYGFWKTRMQSYAVILFFVLSGFLITYLLQDEKQRRGKVNLCQFYRRRILRTLPLYYLVIIVGTALLFLLPGQVHGIKASLPVTTIFYLSLLPNIAAFVGYAPDLINILWSVGAEEQFYAFWPLLTTKSNNLLNRICYFLFLYLVAKYLLTWLDIPHKAWSLAEYMPFDCMAIGGIAACLFRQGSPGLSIIYHPVTQVLAWIFLAVSVIYHPLRIAPIGLLNTDLHAAVYAIIILNVGTNKATIVRLENRLLKFLGKISYGIYGYHFIVLFLLSLMMRRLLPNIPPALAHMVMFAAVLLSTVLLAFLSNRYFESFFTRRKPVIVR